MHGKMEISPLKPFLSLQLDQGTIKQRLKYQDRKYGNILSEFYKEMEQTKQSVSTGVQLNVETELMVSLEKIERKVEKLVRIAEIYGNLQYEKTLSEQFEILDSYKESLEKEVAVFGSNIESTDSNEISWKSSCSNQVDMNNVINDERRKESTRNFYNIVEGAVEEIRRQREFKRERNTLLRTGLKMDFEERRKFEGNWIQELFVAVYSMISLWIDNFRGDSSHVLFLLSIIISVLLCLIAFFIINHAWLK